jgi:hypothetical protein
MDYLNITSLKATSDSYFTAMKQLTDLCPNIEPSCNEHNSRTVMPVEWSPKFGHNPTTLLSKVNWVSTRFDRLMEFGNPKLIPSNYAIRKERWFLVSCGIQIPFHIYAWDNASMTYPSGWDEAGNPIGEPKHTPAQMSEWCEPHYLNLVVHNGIWGKGWGLNDWHVKADEIKNWGNQFADETARANYAKGYLEACKEVETWEREMAKITIIGLPKGDA